MHSRKTPDGRSPAGSGNVHVHSSSQSRPQAGQPQQVRPHVQSPSGGQSITDQLTQAASAGGSASADVPSSAPSGAGSSGQAQQVGGAARKAALPSMFLPVAIIVILFFLMSSGGNSCSVDDSASTGGSAGFGTTSATGGSATGAGGGSSLFGGWGGNAGTFGSGTYDPYQNASTYQIDSALGAGDASDTWTVLMYLCGSNLESASTRQGGGQATSNLVELTKANLGDNVTFAVETGGAKAWQNNVVNPKYLSRYTIENGKMALQDQRPSASMAAESTFADFLTWGVSTYPADHYMVVIWDHGGGTITGVCQDDLYPYDGKGKADSLTLVEMRDAMKKAGVTFDVVGFDTCLMATVETAQILSPYAKYMVASEESEPGSGWDYTAWPNWLAAHPGTTGGDLGTVICQTYYNKCKGYGQSGMATLSTIDLGKIGAVSDAFQNASDDLALATVDSRSLRRLQQGARSAESYGDSSWFYSMNMVDLADLMGKTADVVGSDAQAVVAAIDKAVVYEVHGRNRSGAKGLSVYYPLLVSDRSEFATYAEITDNTPYLQFLAVMFGVYDNYQWNKFENFVPLHGEPVAESDMKIRYKQSQTSDGHLQLKVTQGADQVGNVAFEMYVYLEPLDILCYLGSDNDLNGSYDEGVFTDNFQDDWLTIDGHYVSASLAEVGDGYNLYYIPILLNGEQTGIIVEYDFASNEYGVLCVWDDADQVSGMAPKTARLLQEGDTVQFLFPAANATTGVNDVVPLETMQWHDDAEIGYEGLGDGTFAFRYTITDVLGSETQTDLVYQRYENGRAVK